MANPLINSGDAVLVVYKILCIFVLDLKAFRHV